MPQLFSDSPQPEDAAREWARQRVVESLMQRNQGARVMPIPGASGPGTIQPGTIQPPLPVLGGQIPTVPVEATARMRMVHPERLLEFTPDGLRAVFGDLTKAGISPAAAKAAIAVMQ